MRPPRTPASRRILSGSLATIAVALPPVPAAQTISGAVSVAGSATPRVAPATPAVAPDFYGMNVQNMFSGLVPNVQVQLHAMSSRGVQLARDDARWSVVEPTAPSAFGEHSYDWSGFDQMVTAMAQEGVRWYPILDSAPSWARTVPDSTGSGIAPAGVTDFLDYATALARRYGTEGSFWLSHPSLPQLPVHDYEIWNEENSSVFWRPQTDAPERYADLYAATRSTLQQVDPAARVIVGGLGRAEPPRQTDPTWFLQQMLAHRPDLRGHIDAVGLHPYEPTVAEVYAQIRTFRQGLDLLAGPSVPIDINEIGWATTDVPEAQRAANLQALALELPRSGCNIAHLLPYTWLTAEHDPADSEQWFGIWNLDASSKPSGQAYVDAVMTMRGLSTPPPSPASPICPGPDTTAPAPPPPTPPPSTESPSTWPPMAEPKITSDPRRAARAPRIYFFERVVGLRHARVRPDRIAFMAGRRGTVIGLTWRRWGGATARAAGIEYLDDCRPSCARGRELRIGVDVTLTRPGAFRGRQVYRCFSVRPRHNNRRGALQGCVGNRGHTR